MNHQVICALDTSDLSTALASVKKLAPHVGAFKIGHALTLNHGLSVVDQLQEAGASRIFLDLKFHDIPHSVGLAVREAARRGVWMITVHATGGVAMMEAAAEQARSVSESVRPLVVGVSVLTSLDQTTLTEHLGVSRSIEEHMVSLSELALRSGLDGVVCSPLEVASIRAAFGPSGLIVTPGIRLPGADTHDQHRTADATSTLAAGANYLVIGRALSESADPEVTLREFGLLKNEAR